MIKCSTQGGSALWGLLSILVMGALAALVQTLSEVQGRQAQQLRTERVLALARDALLGRALSDANMPASLPCPDFLTNISNNNVPNDGIADLLSGSQCPAYLGHFPWRTLRLDDLRDGAGARLWYVLSPNFRDDDSARPQNSDTLAQLSWDDGAPEKPVAIVFAPGPALDGQLRSTVQENDSAQFLEGENANGDQVFSRQFRSAIFNDQAIAITRGMLFPLVERRVLREVRACLDEYAALSGGKYPWASPFNEVRYWGMWQTRFGRLPLQPNPLLTAGSDSTVAFVQAAVGVQVALNNYAASNNGTSRAALSSAASQMQSAQTAAVDPIDSNLRQLGQQAADLATSLAKKTSSAGAAVIQAQINSLQGTLNQLRSALSSAGLTDPAMALGWGPRCTVFASGYWESWRNLLFYQLAEGMGPGEAASCGTGCLRISGGSPAQEGSFPAVVISAGAALATQNHANSADVTAYLEGVNQHAPADHPPLNFVTYSVQQVAAFQQVNDQVLCVDGGVKCR